MMEALKVGHIVLEIVRNKQARYGEHTVKKGFMIIVSLSLKIDEIK